LAVASLKHESISVILRFAGSAAIAEEISLLLMADAARSSGSAS
jgi:hypothetical protein